MEFCFLKINSCVPSIQALTCDLKRIFELVLKQHLLHKNSNFWIDDWIPFFTISFCNEQRKVFNVEEMRNYIWHVFKIFWQNNKLIFLPSWSSPVLNGNIWYFSLFLIIILFIAKMFMFIFKSGFCFKNVLIPSI